VKLVGENYATLLPRLRSFTRVLVTGPQRTGTTIGAKMLSVDLGLEFLADKILIGAPHCEGVERLLASGRDGFVLQCPGVANEIRALAREGVAVVWMVRNEADAAASWQKLGGDPGRPARRNARWLAWRAGIPNAFELRYESLGGHPLWVPKEERVGWGPRKISRDSRFHKEIF
jgi:hypothetical protein